MTPGDDRVRCLGPLEAAGLWLQFRPQIRKALSIRGGGLTEASVISAVGRGLVSLWAIGDGNGGTSALAAVEIIRRPAHSALAVIFVAGSGMRGWIGAALAASLSYRRAHGIPRIEAACRPGMARRLARLGWSPEAVVMSSEQE